MVQKLKVDLSDKSYDIIIGDGVFDRVVSLAKKLAKQKIALVIDEKVFDLHEKKIMPILQYVELIKLKGKENTKCFERLEFLMASFAKAKLNRKSIVIALGGGVVGDITGFASSIYMRGIEFYQVPTTLLSMVDSSVGGKTAINIAQGKNLVGTFHQPKGVFIDTAFLKTLDKREFAAGMAEILKMAILADSKFFAKLVEKKLNSRTKEISWAIKKACAMKAKIVSEDEKETAKDGGRALLNLGHTFGHSLENCAGYGEFLHGEAVALGMLMAANLSEKICGLNTEDTLKIKKSLKMYNLPISLEKNFLKENLMQALYLDKKNHSGLLRFVLLEKLGKAFTCNVDSASVEGVFEDFLK